MVLYAVVLLNRVINVENFEIQPKYPPDSDGNEISVIACDSSVKIGMVHENNKFVPYAEPVEAYQPTEGELMIMETQATMHEEMQASTLAQMEANADIYETMIVLGGDV